MGSWRVKIILTPSMYKAPIYKQYIHSITVVLKFPWGEGWGVTTGKKYLKKVLRR